jgi:hypothetical protein
MRIDVELAFLHTPHFHTGKNFPERLCTKEHRGLKLAYVTEDKELLVEWNGRVAHIPESNVRCYFPRVEKETHVAAEKPQLPKISKTPVKAQVSGPQHHVFEGPGAGKR